MATPGRNEPCPCGSGRKFKHCCLPARDEEDSQRTKLRSAEGFLVPALISFALEEFGKEFFDEAWDEFFLWNDAPDDVGESREFGTTFDPFFVFAFVPDPSDDELPAEWPTEPVALHFLHHEVETAPEFHREFIEQACKSPASFFVVEHAVPGRRLDIKDILTGRHFHVLEQGASRSLKAGDLMFSRVVTAGGASILIGACPWVIPASWHIPIIDMRERFRPKGLLTRNDLLDYDLEIRQAYHEVVDAILNPELPVMQNTDGDPLELTTLTYELGIPPARAVECLTPLATLRDEAHISDETYDATGAIRGATLTWIKGGNRKMKDWDNTTLGTLRISEARLVVEVNSARRRRRIEKEIAKHLGAAATLVDTTVTDLADVLTSRRASPSASVANLPPEDTVPSSPELRAIEAELARKHWDAWLDTKVPALGNKTPRQAAKSATGRERLEALLASYVDHRLAGRNAFEPDILALKQRLGMA
ncbi:MAG: SEC-C metal-binding domain-containing protein [Vicinamibacterales bacterium]